MSRLTPAIAVFIMIGAIVILLGNKTLYTVTAAIVALVLFLKVYGGSAQVNTEIAQAIITLGIMLFGIFLVLRAFFPSSNYRN